LSRPIIPASAANRVATTESLRAEAINHFRNKICQEPTYAVQQICAALRSHFDLN
jgi:hypothetical protein